MSSPATAPGPPAAHRAWTLLIGGHPAAAHLLIDYALAVALAWRIRVFVTPAAAAEIWRQLV